MTRSAGVSAAIVLLMIAASRVGAQSTLSLADYINRLDVLSTEVNASSGEPSPGLVRLVEGVPGTWHVAASQQSFDVPTGWLTADFTAWKMKGDRQASARLSAGLRALRSEAALFDRPATDSSRMHGILTGILAGREFRNLHGPTWMDRLRQRALQLIADLLGRLFGLSAIPTIGNVLVYLLIGLAVCTLAIRTYLFIRRDATLETIRTDRGLSTVTPWADWLADAQSAAGTGRWRDAVHAAYWCGVAFLESKGAWRPDRARTPREYLKLLSAGSEHRPALATLTHRFELVWYGKERADAEAFDEAVASLKKMGCLSA